LILVDFHAVSERVLGSGKTRRGKDPSS
jgi:hypothetical protein